MSRRKSALVPTSVHLPEVYIEAMDELVRRGLYPHRAEVIRMAVRDLIMRERGSLWRVISDETGTSEG